jgi:hypothetical protein
MTNAKKRKEASRLYVIGADAHLPKIHKPTRDAMLAYMSKNDIAGFIQLGDPDDNEEISHHNKGKARIEAAGKLSVNTEVCDHEFVSPVENILKKDALKVWFQGNHGAWEDQFVDLYPQLEGTIERHITMRLKQRGWRYIPCGESYKLGKVLFIHGETLKTQFHSKNAVDTYCTNVIYGHFHTLQSYTKVLPQAMDQRWAAWSIPALCDFSKMKYLRGNPISWVNGFGILEVFEGGLFNVTQVVVSRGRFAHGGKVYRG